MAVSFSRSAPSFQGVQGRAPSAAASRARAPPRGAAAAVGPAFRGLSVAEQPVCAKPAACVPRNVTVAAASGAAPPAVPAKPVTEVRGVEVYDLGDRTFMLNGVCDSRFRFAIEYGLDRGTSNNSYVLRGGAVKSNVLIDVPDEAFIATWLEALDTVVKPTEIGTLVLTHVPPGSVNAIVRFLEEATGSKRNSYETLTVVLSNPALMTLRSKLGSSPAGAALLSKVVFVTARRDVPLILGDGSELSFIRVPTPRWPDALAVYEEKTGSLFSSKLFSCHRAPEPGTIPILGPAGMAKLEGDFHYYFQCLLAPVARQAAVALSKLDVRAMADKGSKTSAFAGLMEKMKTKLKGALVGSLPMAEEEGVLGADGERKPLVVRRLCPRHGPVLTGGVPTLLADYKKWIDATIESAARANVAVMYASAYGHTATLAEAISRGITKGGVGVETINLETVGVEEMQKTLDACDGFVLGSPTLGGHLPTQVTAALGTIIRDSHAKQLPCSVFGSYGWSGEAVDEMEQKLKDSGFALAFEPIRSKFRATPEVLETCEQGGEALAKNILVKQRRLKKEAERRALKGITDVASDDTQRALDRVVGALGVVTCRDGDEHLATVVSSISQASFIPPGVTISVERNARTEPLLILNAKFNINLMALGKEQAYAGALKKGGTLDGFEFEESEETECARLPDAASCLECVVRDRMAAGDRWIIYAEVSAGQVLEESALGAVVLPCVM